MILSHTTAKTLIASRNTARFAIISPDLGLSQIEVSLGPERVTLNDSLYVLWSTIDEIAGNENGCYFIGPGGEWEKVQYFSTEFNRLYSLMPVSYQGKESSPTMLISGIPMHRIKGTTPQLDTKEKIRAAGPIRGDVLDTATGLGYTAIAAAAKARNVTTIELDPAVLEICRLNPWSQGLFAQKNIQQEIGDAFDVVKDMPNESFDLVIHDPPMFNLAGHLYSADFYQEILRILRPRGKFFHYIGNPDSKSGKNVTKGVTQRIKKTGFARIKPTPKAFGLIATKPETHP